MAVKLRMTRMGRRHRPFFRINAVESRAPRDGAVLEKLGHYDPIEKDPAKQIVLDLERVNYWLKQGAIPSDTVSQILLRQGIKVKYAEEKTARRARARVFARAKGKPFTKAERTTAQKQAEQTEEKPKTGPAEAAKEKPKAEATKEKPKAEAAKQARAKLEPETKEQVVEEAKAEAKAKTRTKAEAKVQIKAKVEAKAAEEKAKAVAEEKTRTKAEAKTKEKTRVTKETKAKAKPETKEEK